MRPDDPHLGPGAITVGCVNFEAVARDKPGTLEKIVAMIATAASRGCDLVIFPELALNTWVSATRVRPNTAPVPGIWRRPSWPTDRPATPSSTPRRRTRSM